MGIDVSIDITAGQRADILALLERHLPDTKAWAYGSRARWTSRPQSDIDMVVFATPEQKRAVSALREAFEESSLPFRVDLFVWDDVPNSFRTQIERDHVVLADNNKTKRKEFFHPLFPPHWQSRSLHSMATWVNGIAFRNIQFSETGRPVIKIVELKGGISGQTKFTQQTFDESILVRSGDLLFSWSGQPETSIDAFWWKGPEGWLNQHVFKVTPNAELHVVFFYYILRYLRPNFVDIARNKQTTGLGHVTKRDLENIEVSQPSLPEQRAIAGILGALDDKIALNRRMNETLEAMARAIFKDWFVDFGPVRAKIEGRAPYLVPELWELFPDALDGDGKPVGWTRLPLDKIANFLNGLALQKFPALDPGDSLPVIKIAELRAGITSKSSRTSYDIPNRYIVRDGDFLFSWSGSLLAKFWTEGEGALNQHLFKVTSERFPPWFVSQSVLHHLEEFRAIAASKATTMGHIQRRHLKEATTTFPSDGVLSLLGPSIGPLIEHTIKNKLESQKLAETRDLLLPKLMSGEISLRDAERAVEAVAP